MITRYFIRADYIISETTTGAKSSLQSELVRGKNNSELSFANKTEAREHMATLPSTKLNGNYRRDYTYHVEAVEYGFCNMHGWSDVYPFEIIRVVSDKTIEVRAMAADLDQDFKPEVISGGFVGHCVNQNKQSYNYRSCPDGQVLRVRLGKKGWKSTMGKHVLSTEPRKFYDYNF